MKHQDQLRAPESMSEYKVRAQDVLEQAIREAQQLEDDPDRIRVFNESYKTTAPGHIHSFRRFRKQFVPARYGLRSH